VQPTLKKTPQTSSVCCCLPLLRVLSGFLIFWRFWMSNPHVEPNDKNVGAQQSIDVDRFDQHKKALIRTNLERGPIYQKHFEK